VDDLKDLAEVGRGGRGDGLDRVTDCREVSFDLDGLVQVLNEPDRGASCSANHSATWTILGTRLHTAADPAMRTTMGSCASWNTALLVNLISFASSELAPMRSHTPARIAATRVA
jgi:hypothetical protein